jgi:hypothetical protein
MKHLASETIHEAKEAGRNQTVVRVLEPGSVEDLLLARPH